MKQLKVMTVVGTRPEIIRLSRVIAALDESDAIHHILVHTGQNYDYELNQVFFDDLGIRKAEYFLGAAGTSPAETVGLVISKTDETLALEKPDALLVLGDTNSCLAAYPAKRRKIPIFHMEAGNRCFDERVPEEINRKIIDHISDINLPYSDISREYLLQEGLPPDRIIKTGSPMFEVLNYYMPCIERSNVLDRLNLKQNEYFVVSSHREENIDNPNQFQQLIALLNALAEGYGKRVIVSTHPRTRRKIEATNSTTHPLVELLKPLGFCDYVKLQMSATCVLSDSGTITEESSILNFPALNIREAQERPEGMEEAAVMLVGLRWERVQQGLVIVGRQMKKQPRILPPVSDYTVRNVSEKVVRILLSYVDYVNLHTWHRSAAID